MRMHSLLNKNASHLSLQGCIFGTFTFVTKVTPSITTIPGVAKTFPKLLMEDPIGSSSSQRWPSVNPLHAIHARIDIPGYREQMTPHATIPGLLKFKDYSQ